MSEQQMSYISFCREKKNWADWIILLSVFIIAYITIKIYYPFPITISDSATYVNMALNDSFSFYRPFGYAFFLRILHSITQNIHAIFVVQLVMLFVSTSIFAFTIKYYFAPVNKILWYVILCFIAFNPIAFFMANAIMSDLLFGVMVCILLTSFIFFIKKKSWIACGVFIVSMFCLLHIRYSAMIFPALFIILSVVFFKGKYRWVPISALVLISFVFYKQIQNNMEKVVGLHQFSTGFDGWQLANNAMHIIPFIDTKPEDIKNEEVRILYQASGSLKDNILKNTKDGTIPSANFMWSNDFVLKQYLFYYTQQTRQPYPVSWVKLGSGTYKNFGQYLITRHPVAYTRYFVLPNVSETIHPTIFEIFERPEAVTGKPDIISWYDIPEDAKTAPQTDLYNKYLLPVIQKYSVLVWLVFAGAIGISIVYRKKSSAKEKSDQAIIWTITSFIAVYYLSTIIAAPVALRFWSCTFTLLPIAIYLMTNQSALFKRNSVPS